MNKHWNEVMMGKFFQLNVLGLIRNAYEYIMRVPVY